MKRTILFITSLVLIVGCSQKPVEDSTLINKDGLMYLPDSDKPYTGEVFTNYSTGEKLYDGHFINGELSGEYTFYHKNGNVKYPKDLETLVFKDRLGYEVNSDEPYSGKMYQIFDNGIINNFLINGLFPNPTWTFVSSDSQIFKGNLKNGRWLGYNYYDQGFQYNNDLMGSDGDLTDYIIDNSELLIFINKIIVFHLSFKNGTRDITITNWYNDEGKITSKMSYTNCKIVEDMDYGSNYTFGEQDGEFTFWYENGQKRGEGTFKDGEKDGLWTGWYENGQKEGEVTFKDGELISEKCWGENGNRIECK
jgi:antitoxin component YwqK of YwqJK toxin-antitoxin module